MITPSVPAFERSPKCASGISSSTTTQIIAPAANDKKNGNSIFFPYTGVGVEYEVISQDIVCKYWTNNLSDEGTQYADSWTFVEGLYDYGFSEPTLRYSGLPIRPVLP